MSFTLDKNKQHKKKTLNLMFNDFELIKYNFKFTYIIYLCFIINILTNFVLAITFVIITIVILEDIRTY